MVNASLGGRLVYSKEIRTGKFLDVYRQKTGRLVFNLFDTSSEKTVQFFVDGDEGYKLGVALIGDEC